MQKDKIIGQQEGGSFTQPPDAAAAFDRPVAKTEPFERFSGDRRQRMDFGSEEKKSIDGLTIVMLVVIAIFLLAAAVDWFYIHTVWMMVLGFVFAIATCGLFVYLQVKRKKNEAYQQRVAFEDWYVPQAAPVSQPFVDAEDTVMEEDAATVMEENPPPAHPITAETEMIEPGKNHPKFAIGRGQTIGGRNEQQDSFYCSNWTDDAILNQRGLLVAVADGIGGLKDGSLASSTAMSAMQRAFSTNAIAAHGSKKLLALAAKAQADVLALNQDGHHCGCTLVTVLVEGWYMYLASIGDSRIYLYRSGGLITLNREHTLGRENEDQGVLAQEIVSPDNLKRPKAITSYVGKSNIRLIDRTLYPMKLLPGDKIALMSDGIFGTLTDEEIILALRKEPDMAAKEMIESIDARKDARQDNATVIVVAVQ